MAAPNATPRRSGVVHELWVGMCLPVRAFGLIARSPRLLGLALVSAAVTLLSIAALLYALFTWTGELVRKVAFVPHGPVGWMAYWVLCAVTFLALFAVGMNTVPLLALSPLQDPLSETCERLVAGTPPLPFSLRRAVKSAFVSLRHAIARIALLWLGMGLLLLLNLVPGIGSVAWAVLGTLWTMIWLCAEYLDVPLTRHLRPFSAVRRALWRRLPCCLGFGAATYALLWVPVVNLFFIPVAVVAGTLLFLRLSQSGVWDFP